MLRQKLVLAVAAGAVSFGGGAAYAATHGSSHPMKKPAVHARGRLQSNVHVPCHNHGAKITSAQLRAATRALARFPQREFADAQLRARVDDPCRLFTELSGR